MSEYKKPIAPEEVHSWVKKTEADFFSTWGEHIKKVSTTNFKAPAGLGFDHIPVEGKVHKVFTGRGTCEGAVTVINHCMKVKFGADANLNVVNATVRTDNKLFTVTPEGLESWRNVAMNHTWSRFKGTDNKTYFLDHTYGQVNLRLNRAVFDKAVREQTYYRYIGKLFIHPYLDNWNQEREIYYKKVVESLLD